MCDDIEKITGIIPRIRRPQHKIVGEALAKKDEPARIEMKVPLGLPASIITIITIIIIIIIGVGDAPLLGLQHHLRDKEL